MIAPIVPVTGSVPVSGMLMVSVPLSVKSQLILKLPPVKLKLPVADLAIADMFPPGLMLIVAAVAVSVHPMVGSDTKSPIRARVRRWAAGCVRCPIACSSQSGGDGIRCLDREAGGRW